MPLGWVFFVCLGFYCCFLFVLGGCSFGWLVWFFLQKKFLFGMELPATLKVFLPSALLYFSPQVFACPAVAYCDNIGCLERLWSLLWRDSEAIWAPSWVTFFTRRPRLSKEVEMTSSGPFQAQPVFDSVNTSWCRRAGAVILVSRVM